MALSVVVINRFGSREAVFSLITPCLSTQNLKPIPDLLTKMKPKTVWVYVVEPRKKVWARITASRVFPFWLKAEIYKPWASSPARLIAFTNRQLNRGLFLSDRAPPFYAKTQVFHKRHKISSASAVEEALIAISTAEFTLVSKYSYRQNWYCGKHTALVHHKSYPSKLRPYN